MQQTTHLFIYLLLLTYEEGFHMAPLPGEDSHEISSHIYSEKQWEKNQQTIVCCSRDWRLKGEEKTSLIWSDQPYYDWRLLANLKHFSSECQKVQSKMVIFPIDLIDQHFSMCVNVWYCWIK